MPCYFLPFVSHPCAANVESPRLISWVQLVEDAFQGSDTDDEDGDPEDTRPKKALRRRWFWDVLGIQPVTPQE